MSHDELLEILMEVVSELQVSSGLEPPTLSAESKPRELEEFDSLKCLEFEVVLSKRLGVEVEHALIPKDDPDAVLSLGELADQILPVAAAQGDLDV